MAIEVVDLRLPLLVISPESEEFKTAVDCWNAYLKDIRGDWRPADWQLRVQNNYREPVVFDPSRAKVFTDGTVESTYLSGHDGFGNWQLYTRALINHDFHVITGPTFKYPDIGRVRVYIDEQFKLRHP